jgi:hypothetical protein
MPGFLLDQSSRITCLHQGTCQAAPPSPRVRLGGSPALLVTSQLTIVGCTLPPPIAANGPDVTGTWLNGATRIRSMGVPLLLSDAQAICVTSGTGVLVQRTQARVRGI